MFRILLSGLDFCRLFVVPKSLHTGVCPTAAFATSRQGFDAEEAPELREYLRPVPVYPSFLSKCCPRTAVMACGCGWDCLMEGLQHLPSAETWAWKTSMGWPGCC